MQEKQKHTCSNYPSFEEQPVEQLRYLLSRGLLGLSPVSCQEPILFTLIFFQPTAIWLGLGIENYLFY